MTGSGASSQIRTPGVLAAALTPFVSGTDQVDYLALEAELDWLVDNGASAVVVGGVETQEYQVLEGARREELIERSVEALDARLPAIVGVSHPSSQRSLALCRLARSCGAHSVMTLVTLKPWGAVPTQPEVARLIESIVEASELPVVVYNNPRMGVDLSVEAMCELAEMEGVAYFKETSRDLAKLGRLHTEIDSLGHARVFTTMEALLYSLFMGGPGAMMPPPAVAFAAELIGAFGSGDLTRAVELQKMFAQFPGRWMQLGLTPVMKAAMCKVGTDVGLPLVPWDSLGSEEMDDLAAFLSVAVFGKALPVDNGTGPAAKRQAKRERVAR